MSKLRKSKEGRKLMGSERRLLSLRQVCKRELKDAPSVEEIMRRGEAMWFSTEFSEAVKSRTPGNL